MNIQHFYQDTFKQICMLWNNTVYVLPPLFKPASVLADKYEGIFCLLEQNVDEEIDSIIYAIVKLHLKGGNTQAP